MHRPQSMAYNIDQFVLGTLSSSFVLLNIKVKSCLKDLSHNNRRVGSRTRKREDSSSKTQHWVKVVELLTFNGDQQGFGTYRLYIRIKMRNILVEEQFKWVLSYIQRESAGIQKKYVIEDLKNESLKFPMIEDFHTDLKQ